MNLSITLTDEIDTMNNTFFDSPAQIVDIILPTKKCPLGIELKYFEGCLEDDILGLK